MQVRQQLGRKPLPSHRLWAASSRSTSMAGAQLLLAHVHSSWTCTHHHHLALTALLHVLHASPAAAVALPGLHSPWLEVPLAMHKCSLADSAPEGGPEQRWQWLASGLSCTTLCASSSQFPVACESACSQLTM